MAVVTAMQTISLVKQSAKPIVTVRSVYIYLPVAFEVV